MDARDASRDRTVEQSERRHNSHVLVAVSERVPGREPTHYHARPTPTAERSYRTRYFRCRRCGQERTRPDGFREPCESDGPPLPLAKCGLDPLDDRTRRALTEAIDVRYGHTGSEYDVEGASGTTYTVDVAAGTCSCPDYQQRGEELADGCKHLRRTRLEIEAGLVPAPDGTFTRPAARAGRPTRADGG